MHTHLAQHVRPPAGVLEQLRQGGVRERQSGALLDGHVLVEASVEGEAPGKQRGPRRGTPALHIVALEPHATCGQRIEVRGQRQVGVPADGVPADFVRQQKHDVAA